MSGIIIPTERSTLLFSSFPFYRWKIKVRQIKSKARKWKSWDSNPSRLYPCSVAMSTTFQYDWIFFKRETKTHIRKHSVPFKAVILEVHTPFLRMLSYLKYFWNGYLGINVRACSSFFDYLLWWQISLWRRILFQMPPKSLAAKYHD